MDPRVSRIIVDENQIRNMLEWYNEIDILIYNSMMLSGDANNIDAALEIKRNFLHSIDTKVIEEYLSFNKPTNLDLEKLYSLLDNAYAIQTRN